MKTSVASDEPGRPDFATGGIVPADAVFPMTWGCDGGYVLSREAYAAMTAASGAVRIELSWPLDTAAVVRWLRPANESEAEAGRLQRHPGWRDALPWETPGQCEPEAAG